MKRKTGQLILSSLLIAMMLLSGCEKDKKETAPQLPPVSSLSFDIDFGSGKKSTDSYNNVIAAGLAVGYWNTVLYAHLVVPVAAYAEAFNHECERVDNNTFLWSYDVEVNDTLYTAELFADVDGNMIDLEMHISKQGGFQDFTWFTGTCDVLRTSGEWTVFTYPENDAWVSIDWNHDWEAETFDVRYTNTLITHEYADSYIEYGITEDPTFDAYYIIYDSKEDKNFEIDLNTATHAGRIYYDAAWHCWDVDYKDIICAE